MSPKRFSDHLTPFHHTPAIPRVNKGIQWTTWSRLYTSRGLSIFYAMPTKCLCSRVAWIPAHGTNVMNICNQGIIQTNYVRTVYG